MRLSLLLLALLAASASAQDARRAPTTGERVILVTGAVASGLLTAGFVGPFVPLTIAAATYGTSAALGLRPTIGGVALDAAAGTTAGVVVMMGTYAFATEVGGAPGDFGTAFGSFIIGVAVGSATTGLVHGVRLAVLRAPNDEATPGLSLRVDL